MLIVKSQAAVRLLRRLHRTIGVRCQAAAVLIIVMGDVVVTRSVGRVAAGQSVTERVVAVVAVASRVDRVAAATWIVVRVDTMSVTAVMGMVASGTRTVSATVTTRAAVAHFAVAMMTAG